ncbi:MAG: hypothetical protein RLO51_16835 [Thalassobaculum sp.]|uniref:hypothetical protein n=1 Tax=Thalassobaculum sp. TaxID=2022740 RepID=UPI0032EBF5EE
MPTNRRRRRRDLRLTQLSPAVSWWLRHGGYLDHDEAARLGMAGDGAPLQVWLLEGDDDSFGSGRRPLWTRRRLREAGYGEAIDALIAAGRTPPDGYFKRRPNNGDE